MYEWGLEARLFSIPLWNWLVALAAAAVIFVVLLGVLRVLRTRLERRHGGLDDGSGHVLPRMLGRTSLLVLLVFSLMVGMKLLDLPAAWSRGISTLWFAAIVFQAALWLDAALMFGLRKRLTRHASPNAVTMTLLSFTLRAALWAVALLAILDNVGVNITALVASLGIGGVAVALAAQVVLGDLFASISIGLDKPFEQGDFIVVGGIAGTIEHVGLKTTRVRSLGGEQIVCSNAELLKQTIQNYKRMELRRIAFRFVVSYRTSAQQAERIPEAVKALITGADGTRFDRAHLLQFNERGLEYEVVYYVLSADYNRYMDIQQAINIGIMREVESLGLQFGWQELHVHVAAEQGGRPAAGALPAAGG